MKPCKFCGAELPEEALFCPYCEGEQIEREQLRPPRPRHRKRVLGLLLCLALPLTLALLLWSVWTLLPRLAHEPQVYNAGAPVAGMDYTGQDGVRWRLFLSLDQAEGLAMPCERLRLSLPESGEGVLTSLFYAVPEGGTPADGTAFLKLLDHVEIIVAQVGYSEAMTGSQAEYDPAFPLALYTVELRYNARTFFNELGWILYLKNGDVIYMHQVLTVDNRAKTYNAGAPALDMQYPAENGLNYRLFLTFAQTAEKAKPDNWAFFPLQGDGERQIVSHLCAIPECGTLEDGSSFTEQILYVQIRVANIPGGPMIRATDPPFAPAFPFAAATVTLDYDETWREDEIAWCIYMKNGDVIYMHQFVNVGNEPQ